MESVVSPPPPSYPTPFPPPPSWTAYCTWHFPHYRHGLLWNIPDRITIRPPIEHRHPPSASPPRNRRSPPSGANIPMPSTSTSYPTAPASTAHYPPGTRSRQLLASGPRRAPTQPPLLLVPTTGSSSGEPQKTEDDLMEIFVFLWFRWGYCFRGCRTTMRWSVKTDYGEQK
jgi:hypothetical protein